MMWAGRRLELVMKRASLVALAVLLVVALGCPAIAGARTAAPVSAQHRAAVRIEVQGHPASFRYVNGSGVVTTRGILTAWHVVREATWVWVVLWDSTRVQAKSWARLGGQDAALVTLAGRLPASVDPLPIADKELSGGAVRGSCIGYWSFGANDGRRVESIGWLYPDAPQPPVPVPAGRWYWSSIPLGPGMSGSGLVVGGRVVGVACLVIRAGGGCNLTAFARVSLADLPGPTDAGSASRRSPGAGCGRWAR